MKLEELDITKNAIKKDHGNIVDLHSFLLNNNYKIVGQGNYSFVYGNSSSVVIKVGSDKNLDGFVDFIQYVKENSNDPNLPRIGTPRWLVNNWNISKKNHRDFSEIYPDNYFVIAMEKLNKIFDHYKVIGKIPKRDWFKTPEEICQSLYKRTNNTDYNNLLNYEYFDSLVLTVQKIINQKNNLDLHSNNFMMRGDRIVITDPWS